VELSATPSISNALIDLLVISKLESPVLSTSASSLGRAKRPAVETGWLII
jgi:hypothetical protein